jgi:hypothetical protein
LASSLASNELQALRSARTRRSHVPTRGDTTRRRRSMMACRTAGGEVRAAGVRRALGDPRWARRVGGRWADVESANPASNSRTGLLALAGRCHASAPLRTLVSSRSPPGGGPYACVSCRVPSCVRCAMRAEGKRRSLRARHEVAHDRLNHDSDEDDLQVAVEEQRSPHLRFRCSPERRRIEPPWKDTCSS